MNAFKMLAAGLATAVTMGGAAQAATYNATEYMDVVKGACTAKNQTQCTSNGRDKLDNLIDSRKDTFYSLGLGGEVTLGFGTSFSAGTASVYEITFSRPTLKDRHYEAVELYALDADKNEVGYSKVITNLDGSASFKIDGAFTYLKLKDVTSTYDWGVQSSSFDGFDVGMVSIAAVPVPAAGGLLLAGLGGLAALRRRKKNA